MPARLCGRTALLDSPLISSCACAPPARSPSSSGTTIWLGPQPGRVADVRGHHDGDETARMVPGRRPRVEAGEIRLTKPEAPRRYLLIRWALPHRWISRDHERRARRDARAKSAFEPTITHAPAADLAVGSLLLAATSNSPGSPAARYSQSAAPVTPRMMRRGASEWTLNRPERALRRRRRRRAADPYG